MNEEEKQAVEKMQYVLDLINKNGEYTADEKDIKHIIVITNLIIKYQKEIEKLNLENIELKQRKIIDKNSIPNQDNFYDYYNFISKDKIRKKIDLIDKEYAEIIEKNKNDLYIVNINAQRHSAMQLILEELLGE